jgi:hypothetical protein
MRSTLALSISMLLAGGCDPSSNSKKDAGAGTGNDAGTSLSNDGGQTPDGGQNSDGGSGGTCSYPNQPHTIDQSTLTGGAHWTSGIYTLQTSLTITSGVLEVDPCTKIIMPQNGRITVRDNGALSLSGTENGPILVTSSKSSPQRGDWSYIEFYSSSDNGMNKLENVVVEYGGSGGYGALWLGSDAQVAVSKSIIRESKDFGIQLVEGAHLKAFTGNTLTANTKGPIELGADSVDDLGLGTYTPNTVEGIQILSEAVAHDATWLKLDAPYIAKDGFSASVDSGSAHLTVASGVVLKLGAGTNISVRTNGGLTLAGTEAAPITITSAKGSPAAGDWGYIELYADSSRGFNRIDHAVIEYGGGSGYGAIWVAAAADLHMKDSTIQSSAHLGLQLVNGAKLLDFTGNKLINNAKGPVQLGANAVDSLGMGTYSPNTVEGIQISAESVAHDATWLKLDAPYVAQSGFTIAVDSGSAVLSLEPGVALLVGPDATITVRNHGALTLNGTATNKVRITSAKASPAAGDWNEIDIYSDSQGSKNAFHYAEISYGGYSGKYGQVWLDSNASVTLDNVTFTNGKICDVDVNGAAVTATNTTYITCPN